MEATPTILEECKAGQHTLMGTSEKSCQCGFYPRPTYNLCRVDDPDCEACQ